METSADFLPQAAAIPVRGQRVCLITSSTGKRWVIPKGIIDPGHTAPQTALQEAWEEAGLAGTLEQEPVGTYCYGKWGRVCRVTVFRMQVTDVAETWPECKLRKRVWLSFAEAAQRVDEGGLRELLRAALAEDDGPPVQA